MANVSSSNGLEKRPKLRFPGFDEPYKQCRIGDIYAERSQRGASDMELLSVTMNDGVMPRSEIESKDNSSEDKSNYKVVLTGDMVYNVADGLFCREIDGLFCRSSPDIIVRRRCVLSHKRRGWLQPSPSFRYSRNLALQDELYHPVINNGPAVLVCVDKRLGTGPVNQSRDAG